MKIPSQINLKNTTFLTDGGIETDLIFNKGINLPHFAAFPLVENPKHANVLISYYKDYLELAKSNNTGFIIESPTWRANPDWAYKLGYSEKGLIRVNKTAIELMKVIRKTYQNDIETIYISGCIGPRSDGYTVNQVMSPSQASQYHELQIKALKDGGADLVSAITMTYIGEAMGIVLEAQKNDIPVVISFTVETDGHLPSGETLESAITKIDEVSHGYPLYYMINCAHPTHFIHEISHGSEWKHRIQGIRANASCKSHAELDECTELDKGNAEELGALHGTLQQHLPNLKVFGGCCGTDVSHIKSICNHIFEPHNI